MCVHTHLVHWPHTRTPAKGRGGWEILSCPAAWKQTQAKFHGKEKNCLEGPQSGLVYSGKGKGRFLATGDWHVSLRDAEVLEVQQVDRACDTKEEKLEDVQRKHISPGHNNSQQG